MATIEPAAAGPSTLSSKVVIVLDEETLKGTGAAALGGGSSPMSLNGGQEGPSKSAEQNEMVKANQRRDRKQLEDKLLGLLRNEYSRAPHEQHQLQFLEEVKKAGPNIATPAIVDKVLQLMGNESSRVPQNREVKETAAQTLVDVMGRTGAFDVLREMAEGTVAEDCRAVLYSLHRFRYTAMEIGELFLETSQTVPGGLVLNLLDLATIQVPEVREMALTIVNGLVLRDFPEAEVGMLAALKSSQQELQLAAAEAIEAAGGYRWDITSNVPEALAKLVGPTSDVRLRTAAVKALGRVGDLGTIPDKYLAVLVTAMGLSPDSPEVEAAVMEVVANIAARPAVQEVLVQLLTSLPATKAQQAAIGAVEKAGAKAAMQEVLVQLLTSLHAAKAQRAAIGVVEKAGVKAATPEVLKALATVMGPGSEPATRCAAADAVGSMGAKGATPEVLEALMEMMAPTSPRASSETQQAAIGAVEKAGVKAATSGVLKALAAVMGPGSRPAIRCAAADVVGSMGAEGATPEVLEALVQMMAPFSPRASSEAQQAAIRAVGRIGDVAAERKVLQALTTLTAHALELGIRCAALDTLESMGEKAATPMVLEALVAQLMAPSSFPTSYLKAAIRAIGKMGAVQAARPGLLQALTNLLGPKQELDVRCTAVDALGSLGEKGATPEVLRGIRRLIHPTKSTPEAQRSSITAVGKMGGAAADPEVLKALATLMGYRTQPEIWEAAVVAVGKMGARAVQPEVLKALVKLMDPLTDAKAQEAAARAVGQMGAGAARQDVLEGLETLKAYSNVEGVRDAATETLQKVLTKRSPEPPLEERAGGTVARGLPGSNGAKAPLVQAPAGGTVARGLPGSDGAEPPLVQAPAGGTAARGLPGSDRAEPPLEAPAGGSAARGLPGSDGAEPPLEALAGGTAARGLPGSDGAEPPIIEPGGETIARGLPGSDSAEPPLEAPAGGTVARGLPWSDGTEAPIEGRGGETAGRGLPGSAGPEPPLESPVGEATPCGQLGSSDFPEPLLAEPTALGIIGDVPCFFVPSPSDASTGARPAGVVFSHAELWTALEDKGPPALLPDQGTCLRILSDDGASFAQRTAAAVALHHQVDDQATAQSAFARLSASLSAQLKSGKDLAAAIPSVAALVQMSKRHRFLERVLDLDNVCVAWRKANPTSPDYPCTMRFLTTEQMAQAIGAGVAGAEVDVAVGPLHFRIRELALDSPATELDGFELMVAVGISGTGIANPGNQAQGRGVTTDERAGEGSTTGARTPSTQGRQGTPSQIETVLGGPSMQDSFWGPQTLLGMLVSAARRGWGASRASSGSQAAPAGGGSGRLIASRGDPGGGGGSGDSIPGASLGGVPAVDSIPGASLGGVPASVMAAPGAGPSDGSGGGRGGGSMVGGSGGSGSPVRSSPDGGRTPVVTAPARGPNKGSISSSGSDRGGRGRGRGSGGGGGPAPDGPEGTPQEMAGNSTLKIQVNFLRKDGRILPDETQTAKVDCRVEFHISWHTQNSATAKATVTVESDPGVLTDNPDTCGFVHRSVAVEVGPESVQTIRVGTPSHNLQTTASIPLTRSRDDEVVSAFSLTLQQIFGGSRQRTTRVRNANATTEPVDHVNGFTIKPIPAKRQHGVAAESTLKFVHGTREFGVEPLIPPDGNRSRELYGALLYTSRMGGEWQLTGEGFEPFSVEVKQAFVREVKWPTGFFGCLLGWFYEEPCREADRTWKFELGVLREIVTILQSGRSIQMEAIMEGTASEIIEWH